MIASVEDKALELIKASQKGVLQSDLWKDLDIDSRKCSRVIARLEAEGKIKRTWETVSGTRTYRLSYVPPKKEAPKKVYHFDLVLAEDEVAPCVGCTYECEPDYCPDLGNWIELLAIDEAKRAKREEKHAHAEKIADMQAEMPAEEAEPEEKPAKAPAKKAEKAVEKPAKAAKHEEKPVEKAPRQAAKPEKAPTKKHEKIVKAETPVKAEKPVAKPAAKTAAKLATKPVEKKPAEKPAGKPAAKPVKKAEKPEAKVEKAPAKKSK